MYGQLHGRTKKINLAAIIDIGTELIKKQECQYGFWKRIRQDNDISEHHAKKDKANFILEESVLGWLDKEQCGFDEFGA